MGVHEAVTSTTTPRTALNWLRNGAGARLLADIAAGELACTHQALDTHPQARAADYLRHVLVASGAYRQGRGPGPAGDLGRHADRRPHTPRASPVAARLRHLAGPAPPAPPIHPATRRRGHPPATPAPGSWPPAAS